MGLGCFTTLALALYFGKFTTYLAQVGPFQLVKNVNYFCLSVTNHGNAEPCQFPMGLRGTNDLWIENDGVAHRARCKNIEPRNSWEDDGQSTCVCLATMSYEMQNEWKMTGKVSQKGILNSM